MLSSRVPRSLWNHGWRGGWADEGLDSAAHSSTFAENLAVSILAGEKYPRVIMAYAHAKTFVRVAALLA
jgi:hypothetical protein